MNAKSTLQNLTTSAAGSTSCCGSVIVRYIDLASNRAIAREEILRGPTGFPYELNHGSTGPEISGYTFDSLCGQLSGIFTGAEQTATYYYVRSCGMVLIRCREICTGVALSNNEVINGQIDTRYSVPYGFDGPVMPGFRLVMVKGPVYGTYRSFKQAVTYYYKRTGPGPLWYLTEWWPFNNR